MLIDRHSTVVPYLKLCAIVSCMWLFVSFQADYGRRLLQLCNKGCTADISQFRELLRQGVDINIYDKVGILYVNDNYGHYVLVLLIYLFDLHLISN